MRKLNLKSYEYEATEINSATGAMRKTMKPYDVKEILVNLLFGQKLALNAVGLLKQNELAKKILTAKNEVLLEEEEYERVKKASDLVEGYGRHDVEFVERIKNAETVKVGKK